MKTHNTQRAPRKKRRFRPVFKRRQRTRPRRPFPRQAVPSFFTLMNLLSGFLSIIHVVEGEFEIAAWLIVIAGAFDALDGFMARATDGSSEFGIELDSLCDLVSFGVAPAFLLYNFTLHEFSTVGMLVAAMIVLCGAVRLARFNLDAKTEDTAAYFKGLPIPAQAVMFAAFFLTFWENLYLFEIFEYGVNAVVIPAILLFSFLMVSAVPFDKIPKFNRAYIRTHRTQVLLYLVYIGLILIFQEYGLMAAFSIFIFKGLAIAAYRFFLDMFEEDGDHDRDIDDSGDFRVPDKL